MAKHTLQTYWEVVFNDGTKETINFKPCYYFHEQKSKYLILWLEQLIKEKNIKATPIEIAEHTGINECDEYTLSIGV